MGKILLCMHKKTAIDYLKAAAIINPRKCFGRSPTPRERIEYRNAIDKTYSETMEDVEGGVEQGNKLFRHLLCKYCCNRDE